MTHRRFLLGYVVWFLSCLLTLAPTVQADWTSGTGAELSSTVADVSIEADRITLRLEIGDEDRETFATLLSGDRSKTDFFHHGLVLAGHDGMPLMGSVNVVERRLRTDRPTSLPPAAGQVQRSPEVTYVEIDYALSERPEALTLTPPMQDDGVAAADIGLIVYHQSIPVIDFQYLQSRETLRLDWRDPWYSTFDNARLKRHHRAPLMTFLYVEPYEVRYEILIRLQELSAWLTLDVPNRMQIDMTEQTRLRERIGQFFTQHSQVRIDGTQPRPILDRVEFVEVTPQGIQPRDASEPLTLHAAMVGVILAYITAAPPQEVTVDWTLFNDRITSVPSTMIDPVSQLPYDLTPEAPTLRWTNMLANYGYRVPGIDAIAAKAASGIEIPLPSVLLCLTVLLLYGLGRFAALQGTFFSMAILLLIVAAIVVWPHGRVAVRNPFAAPPQLGAAEATTILQGLLQNTYRAFDFRAEDDIYDKLAASVTGDLITDIYVQSRKRLAMEEQGGARVKVEAVEVLEVKPIGVPDARQRQRFQCTWRIAGSVGHWGHTHWRRNQYEALIAIEPVEQSWKVVALDLIDERRLP